MPRCASILVLVGLASQVAEATPVVENLYVPVNVGGQDVPQGPDFVDVGGSEKTIAIPPGTAYISWSMNLSFATTASSRERAFVRPVIGGDFPAEGLGVVFVEGWGTATGSWATPTAGGTVTVKLQVKNPITPVDLSTSDKSLSWTLIVFPEAISGVPAVDSLGLGVLVLLLLGAGGAVIAKRRRTSA